MTEAAASGRLSVWCGWVLAALLTLTPVAAWLGPLAFAPLVAIAGLLTLPAASVRDPERPAAIALIVLVAWAVGSSIWSPYAARSFLTSSAVKLPAEGLLYWSVVSAARTASPGSRAGALQIFAWGMAGLGVVLLIEGATGAGIYRAMRQGFGAPIRPDLGVKNVAQGLFVLTLLAPSAMVAAFRAGRAVWLAPPVVAGLVVPSLVFGYDAPLIALVLSLAAGLAVYRLPKVAPRALAASAALFFLGAPAIVWAVRMLGWYEPLEARVPLSWAERMGYWRHAAGWIEDHTLRGWGLEASRMFAPGIQLHPHDSALQIWLELGLIGATAAAVFWVAVLSSTGRKRADLAAAATAATAVVYLTFGAFSFGVWQEWWLGLGALAAAACVAVQRQPARGTSTVAAISE